MPKSPSRTPPSPLQHYEPDDPAPPGPSRHKRQRSESPSSAPFSDARPETLRRSAHLAGQLPPLRSPHRSLASLLHPEPVVRERISPLHEQWPTSAATPGSGVTTPASGSSRETESSGSHRTVGPPIASSDYAQWTYQLEIVQQPQRARACGFGDKDRRPLSPPPILRLWVRYASGQIVDINLVDTHFLVLLVSLWSADAVQQHNVVIHPSTQLSHQSSSGPSSRPNTAPSRPTTAEGTSWPGGPFRFPPASASHPYATSPGLSPGRRVAGQEGLMPPPMPVHANSPLITGWSPAPSPIRPQFARSKSHTSQEGAQYLEPLRPMTAPSRPLPQTRGSPSRLHMHLPPLSSITRDPPRLSTSNYTLPSLQPSRYSITSSISDGRHPSWSTQSSLPPAEYRPGRHGSASSAGWQVPLTPGRETFADAGSSDAWSDRPNTAERPMTGYSEPYNVKQEDIYGPPPDHGGLPQQHAESEEPPRSSADYSRVLVGSLCSTCQRLQDEHGQPGLFFFAHDLGVRTEGIFTLKFTLTNLASLMGGTTAPGEHVRVLAENYSTPFTVYSAKRFPGVIPTTELTRVFARQNVRLPTRQRRTREDTPGGEGVSGGAENE